MIPYFQLDTIPLLGSDCFSFFLLASFLASYYWFQRRALQHGFPRALSFEVFCFTIIPAFFSAHFFYLFIDSTESLLNNPWILLKLNYGLSSFGGILSFFIFLFIYLWSQAQLAYWTIWVDLVIQGLIVAMAVGRIGCTLIHDHPGMKSDFFLAVRFPEGAKHDLGLYEFMFTGFILFPLSVYMHRRGSKPGMQFFVFSILYGAFRFFGDSLRIDDIRFWDHTAAQYSSLALIALGLFTVWHAGLFREMPARSSFYTSIAVNNH